MQFYPGTNKPIKAGVNVSLGESLGQIVFVLDDEQFTPNYPKEKWIYLKKEKNGRGTGIFTEKYGLMVEEEPSNDPCS
jgi:hypothetical protein